MYIDNLLFVKLFFWFHSYNSVNKRRQTWNRYPHMFHLIGKQQLDLQAQPAGATFVPFVGFLPIILVLDVVCASVHIVVKMYTMILGA